MSCFVKKSVLLDSKATRKEACELVKIDVAQNLKTMHDVEFGTKTKYLIANLETKMNLDHLKLQLRSCFVQVTTYLQSHLPHQSIFFKDLVFIQPDQRQNSKSPSAIRRIVIKIGNVLKNTKFTALTPGFYAD